MRIFRYLKRYTKPRLPGRLLFTHVPKTGGTSVDLSIRSAYRIPKPEPDYEAVRAACIDLMSDGSLEATGESAKVLCHYALQKEWSYIAGHFPTRSETLTLAKKRGYTLATIVRDPVERFISNYIYHYIRLWELGLEEPPPVEDVTDQFRRRFYDDIQNDVRFQGSAYQRFFGGASAKDVIKRMSRYDIVGVTHSLTDMEEDFRAHGFKVRIGHANKTSKLDTFSSRRQALNNLFEDPKLLSKIRERTQLDKRVFNHFDN